MKIGSIIVLLLLCSCASPGTAPSQAGTAPQPAETRSITLGGQLRAFVVLGQSTVTVPWKEYFTLEQVIKDMGGFTEYAWHIRLTDADGKVTKHRVRDFLKDESIRKMKVPPGMTIFVDRMMD